MNKLDYHNNKTLKLTNVLKYRVLMNEDEQDINVVLSQMDAYIRTKGAMQIGPLIQYTRTFVNAVGELEAEMELMLQCNTMLHNVEQPYRMEPVVRIPNAMYCRFHGKENDLRFAYSKIALEAYEADVKLSDCNYTIFVGADEDEETMTADVFIPRAQAG